MSGMERTARNDVRSVSRASHPRILSAHGVHSSNDDDTGEYSTVLYSTMIKIAFVGAEDANILDIITITRWEQYKEEQFSEKLYPKPERSQ